MKTKLFLKNLEKGQVLPILVIGILVIIMMAALMIDGGMLMAHRRTAQAAADAGALAGAAYLCPNDYQESTAISKANEFALANINNDHKSSSGTSNATVTSKTIRVETSVSSQAFFAPIFEIFGLTAVAAAEANCTPAGMVGGALPLIFPCDPVVDDPDNKTEFGNCNVIYGDPDAFLGDPDYKEKNVQHNLDNDQMTILFTSHSVTIECIEEDEEGNQTGNIQCSDNVVAMGDRGWIYLEKDANLQTIRSWITGGEQHTAVIGIGYWLSSKGGNITNLYFHQNQPSLYQIMWQDRYVPIYNKQCDKSMPEDQCPKLWETGDNQTQVSTGTGITNYRINAFALFRITCVAPNKDGYECPFRDEVTEEWISEGIIKKNDMNSINSVEGYFVTGTASEGTGGGDDFKLYTVQLTK